MSAFSSPVVRVDLDQTHLAKIRLSGEAARMRHLERLLGRAAPEESNEARRTALCNRIRRRAAWAAELTTSADAWQEWHSELRSADDLVDEVVALLMTHLLRSDGLDEGTFDAAEALVDELTKAAGVEPLVLAHTQEMESIDHSRRSVSLRFPGSQVWDLPFLGHEFGHHVVDQLRHLEPGLADRRPLRDVAMSTAQTLAADGETPDRSVKHAEELLADVLATICCGPTYPIACLILRVPGDAQSARATSSHPAWRDRVATMCETLDALSDETRQARHRNQRQGVVDPLADQLLPGTRVAVSAGGEVAARQACKAVCTHRPGLVYAAADRAIHASGLLAQDSEPDPPDDVSVRAVLDGAWRWRMAHPSDDDTDVVTRATAWCRIARPSHTRAPTPGDRTADRTSEGTAEDRAERGRP